MKLKLIRLNNFRQFYGQQELPLSTDPDRNVTLIHAENGVGKTTILNSVMWCFYGTTTKKFEKPDDIVNYAAAEEGATTASVEVVFEHEGATYSAQRRHKQNDKKNESSLTVHLIKDGVYQHLDAEDSFINSVVPKEMARYFFFDGEHAETFSAEGNYKEVGQAIRNMLGCHIAQTGIDDLAQAAKYFNQQIGNLPGEIELNAYEQRLLEIDETREKLKIQRDECISEKEALEAQIDSILKKLRVAEGAQEIQKQRDERSRELAEVAAQLKTAEQSVIKWIGTRAYSLVARKLTTETLSFIDEASLKGRIPSPYNEEFVKGMLAVETCVCGRPLHPETEEWKCVAELLKSASTAEVQGRVVRARGRISTLKEFRKDAPKLLENAQQSIASLVEKRRRLEVRIGELSKQLEGAPLKDIAEKEKAYQELSRKLAATNQRLGILSGNVNRHNRLYEDIEKEIDFLAGKSGKAKRFVVRRDLAQRAADLLRALLQQHQMLAKAEITKLINDILIKTARRDYTFNFADNFGLELFFADGRAVPRSSGENQLMSLAFIAALVQFSSSRTQESGNSVLIPGTVAPLVLDSPFGQLDKQYRVDTARFVPALASQVVLLVSSSQGDKDVVDTLRKHVDLEFVLISENKGSRGEKSSDLIAVRGKEIATSIFNCERNRTRIERIQ